MIDCFVSYCGDDAPDIHVEKLVEELRRLTNNEVNFRVYYEEEYGSSLKDFMRVVLLEAPAVLVLFGPEYKRRIEESRSKSGVYQEYDTIVSRLEDLASSARTPKIIPILWAGKSIEDVFPQYFQSINLRACDLRGFRAHGMTQHRAQVPKPILATYASRLAEIAKQLKLAVQIGGADAIAGRTAILDRFLTPDAPPPAGKDRSIKDILQIKYELGVYDPREFRSRYFTSTRAFRHLTSQNVGLVSGRKGSGKTTLVQIGELDARDTEYFPVIDIAVERWNLHYLIEGSVFKQSEGDFEYIDLEVRLFDYIWPCFTAFCMCHSLLHETNGPRMKPHDLIISSRVADKLKSVAHQSANAGVDYSSLFTLAVNCAKEFIQSAVDLATDESEGQFRLEVLEAISLRKFLYSLFGNNFSSIKSGIFSKGNKRFLFCLDRFDNEIQQYRKDAIERSDEIRAARIRREIDWLSSLTLFVHKTLRPDQLADDREIFEFFSRLKFLIVLPYDRLIELRNSQRDSVSNETIEEIRWQPKELLTMLRKRIQVLHDISDEQMDRAGNNTPQERYERVLSLTYPDIPASVPVVIGTKRFGMELFLNVLRHSFFRPRDILIHFSSVLSYVDTMAKKGRRPDVEAIREAISNETRTIVTYEFVGELRDTWRNVEEVLGLFRGGNQLIAARDLSGMIGATEFVFYDDSSSISTIGEKIAFLYRIGFLGYRPVRQAGRNWARREFTFAFLSQTPPPVFDGEASLRQFEFAVHPIFIDSLFLHTNVDQPVLYLDWRSLEALDRVD